MSHRTFPIFVVSRHAVQVVSRLQSCILLAANHCQARARFWVCDLEGMTVFSNTRMSLKEAKGRRLQRSAEALATAASNEPCKELVVGFDGGYVKNRH